MRCWLPLLLALLLPFHFASAGDKIESIKKQVKQSSKRKSRSASDGENGGNSSLLNWLLLSYFSYVLSDLDFRYALYPYQRKAYIVGSEEEPKRLFALTIRSGFQFVDRNTNAFLGALRLRIPSGSSFSFRYSCFAEESGGATDYLSFYSLMQRASLFRYGGMDLTIDFGGAHLPGLARGGPTWGFGVMAFVQKPLVLDVLFRQHFVTPDCYIIEGDFELGVTLRRFEIMTGYRVFRFVGWAEDVDLSGFCISVRIWL